eukprot:23926-Amorphochlora_amoeboformis.AAC.2
MKDHMRRRERKRARKVIEENRGRLEQVSMKRQIERIDTKRDTTCTMNSPIRTDASWKVRLFGNSTFLTELTATGASRDVPLPRAVFCAVGIEGGANEGLGAAFGAPDAIRSPDNDGGVRIDIHCYINRISA